MYIKSNPSFLTLLLMISFASVNAVLFTPFLPAIASSFAISEGTAQLTITWFLIGYAVGQLLYAPVANRFGRKPTLYAGISLQILSSVLCIVAGFIHIYFLLVLGRFLLALGSGVGLKMTFTLVNETYEPIIANQKLAYLMIAFAITPGLAVMIGGLLATHFNWNSSFYASAFYGFILLLLATRLPETKKELEVDALKLNRLMSGYLSQFKNLQLMSGGLLMGGATCFVYVFAAIAPFIAINMLHMDTSTYGLANLLPPIGLILGSFISAQLTKKFSTIFIIGLGILVALIGSGMMFIFLLVKFPAILAIFFPLIFCYFGLSLVFSNASIIAMKNTDDKAHGSAVMNFINMGLATIVVLTIGKFSINILLLPIIYICICFLMLILNKFVIQREKC